MKPTTPKEAEEEYKEKIKRVRLNYNRSIRDARNMRDFFVAPTHQDKAKLLKKFMKSKDKSDMSQVETMFNRLMPDDRTRVSRWLLEKQTSVKVHVSQGRYMSLSNLKLSESHYSIQILVNESPRLLLRHPHEVSTMPTDEQVINVCKSYLPAITTFDIRRF